MTGFRWLASYPRSGNTWTRLLLDSYCREGAAVDINRIASVAHHLYDIAAFDQAIGLSSADLTDAEIIALRPAALRSICGWLAEPALVKCHDVRYRQADGTWQIPADVSLGGVYLVRDPRDVVLSLANLLDSSIDEAISRMENRGQVMGRSITRQSHQLPNLWGSWSENVESWLGPDPFPVHVVRYEDLRRDPVATFFGMLLALGIEPREDQVTAAVRSADLSTLRLQEQQQGFAERRSQRPFFGAGRVGSWQDGLTTDQVARIEAAHGPTMRRLGYLD